MAENKNDGGGGSKFSGLLGSVVGPVVGLFTTGPAVRALTLGGLVLILVAILRGLPKLLILTSVQTTLFALLGTALLITALVLSKTDSDGPKGAADLLGVVVLAMVVLGIVFSILAVLTYFRVIPMPARYSPRADLDEVLIALGLASLCGFLPPLMVGRHFQNIPKQQRLFLNDLEKSRLSIEKSRDEMVERINDATRTRLKGFPMVFDKALYMIRHAEQELIYVNFAMNFGSVHLHNEKVGRAYDELDSSHRFSNDIRDFLRELKAKVDKFPDVQILTVSSDNIKENFLRPISERDGYGALRLDQAMDAEIRGAIDAKKAVQYQLDHPTDTSLKGSSRRVLVETDSLPIQLLITKIKDGDGPLRRGCLVFMVGTAMLSGLESGGEPAFYTEMDDMIYMFENVATALIAGAKQAKAELST